MKKIIYTILISFLLINSVEAFTIDVDKIDIKSKSESIISNLDSSYKIDTQEFNNKILKDENINEYAKKILKISFSDKSIASKNEELVNNMYMSSSNGFDTLSATFFIDNYLNEISTKKIKIERIRDIKIVLFNNTDRMVFIYADNASVNGKEENVVISYWLKSNDSKNFKLYYPWVTSSTELINHFNSLIDNENKGINIGGTFNEMNMLENNNMVSTDILNNLYIQNKESVVQITGMNESGSNLYGSGFFIREGVIVTTWSLFLQFLTNSNYIYVNDVYGNTYNVLGVVAAQSDYDVVVLKISSEVGKKVTFGNSNNLNVGDKLFTINSKSNSGFSINYGTNLSVNNGRIENVLVLNDSDVGSALFNQNGEVVGFNVADQLYSELSYANSTDYLKELQKILSNMQYTNVKYTILDTFKQNYYLDIHEEKVVNTVPEEVWDKYKMIGKLGKNINLKLLKASYTDKVLSLRYKNNTNGMIESVYLVSDFITELENQGYKLSYQGNDKSIYINKNYKIIIKNNLNYLIILIMEI